MATTKADDTARLYRPRLTGQQISLIDDALDCYFKAHFDMDEEGPQKTAPLLDLITDTRLDLAQVLPCSECSERRMGYHSDLCSEHYAQLTRGELKIRV